MNPFEGLGWWYRSWQDAISSSWQLQVKVFGAILLIAALAALSTSYCAHSWPFGSPGARTSQEKAVQAAFEGNSSQNPHVTPSHPAAPNIAAGKNTSDTPNTLKGMQLCPDPDGDGTLVLCKSTYSIDQFSSPSGQP